MIGFPYPKRLNSNNAVEQGAAVLVCSVEAAERLGVPRDRWVFPHAGADAHDAMFTVERHDLHSSASIRIAGGRALELAGVGVDDVAHVDLYSCFPSAVQVAANELGLGLDRDLTVTGGLSFAGGPWNNYVTHAIATMVDVLRDDPGSVGPRDRQRRLPHQARLRRVRHRAAAAGSGGTTRRTRSTPPPRPSPPPRATRARRPSRATPSCTTGTARRRRASSPCAPPDGAGRTWGTTRDADVLGALEDTEHVGRSVRIDAEGAVALFVTRASGLEVVLAQPLHDLLHHPHRRLRHLVEQPAEALGVEGEHLHRREGAHVGGAGRWSMSAISPTMSPGPSSFFWSPPM